ncbi:DedA family protein [Phycicoccus avicenniae]|uniref:DedA family protein n=1 Tax=Phycicoccus avicenniae TaxID=2828860 RepID=UPI003D2B0584
MLTDVLGSLPAWPLALLLAASVLAESGTVVGMLLPGTTAVIGLGVLAGVGAVPAPVVYLLAVVAAVAGTSLGWRSGRDGGAAVRSSRLGQRVGESRWALADDLLARRGTQAVVVAQFVVVARTLVPRIIGMSGTPYRRFARASVPAATLWAVSLTLLGHLAGSSWDAVSAVLGRASVSVAVLAGVVLALAWSGRLVAGHPHWLTTPVLRAPLQRLRLVRRRVEEGSVSVAGSRAGHVVSALLWSVGAILVGVVTTVVVLVAVARTGLRSLDRPVADWLADHASPAVTDLSLATVSVLRTPFVVLLAAAVALGVLVRHRRRLDAQERLRVLIPVAGLAALALATKGVIDAVQHHREAPGDATDETLRFLFVNQLAVVPCALVLAAVVLAPWLSWGRRVTVWTSVAVVVTVLVAARLLSGFSTISEAVVALVVGLAWSVLLASAVRPPAPAEDPEDSLAVAGPAYP